MGKLYEELREIGMHDATVHHFLKRQSATDASDLEIAILLIKQLSREKKAYFDDAVNIRNLSVIPVQVSVKELHLTFWQKLNLFIRGKL